MIVIAFFLNTLLVLAYYEIGNNEKYFIIKWGKFKNSSVI